MFGHENPENEECQLLSAEIEIVRFENKAENIPVREYSNGVVEIELKGLDEFASSEVKEFFWGNDYYFGRELFFCIKTT